MGWTGTLAVTRGGSGLSSATLGDIWYSSAANTMSALAGNTVNARRFLRQTGTGTVSAAPVWDTLLAADVPGSALTGVNDTNVTLTLGGTPSTALLAATSLTMGWTGTLAVGRGGTGNSTLTTNGVLYGNAASAVNVTAAAGANMVLWANSGAPSFTAAPVIGTSVTCPLHIGGTAAGSTLTLESTSGAGTTDYINFLTASQSERGRVDTNGNINFGMNGGVLVGANGLALTPKFQLAWANAVQDLELRQYTADTNPAHLTFVKSRSNTLGTNTAASANDFVGQINFDGYDTTPTARSLATIQAFVDGTPSATSFPGAFVFNTTTAGVNTVSEKWRINNAGTLRYSVLPTGAAVVDGSNSTQLSVAQGASALIMTASDGGLVIITNQNTGDVGCYLVNNNGCKLVATTLGNWVAPTTTPAGTTMSVNNVSSAINVYNGATAGTRLFRVFTVLA
jgi:hypothetical protein